MARPPFRTGTVLAALGQEIHEKVCAACWQAWLESSVKLVNELRLDLLDPRGQFVWTEHLRAFVGLGATQDPWTRFVDRRVRVETLDRVIAEGTVVRMDDTHVWLADFAGATLPQGFEPAARGANGEPTSGAIARDRVVCMDPAGE